MSQAIDLSYFSLYLFIEDRRCPSSKYLDPDFDRYRSAFEARMHANPDEYFGVGNNTHSDGGVGLIGRSADYVVRNAEGRPMLWYRRRIPLPGDSPARLRGALRDLLTLAEDLAADPRMEGAVSFSVGRVQLFVDRALEVRNTEAAYDQLVRDLAPAVSQLFGERARVGRPTSGGRLGVEIHTTSGMTARQLLGKLVEA